MSDINGWMVRAGRGGKYFEEFAEGKVAIGWNALGDLTQYANIDALREAYIAEYGNAKPSQTNNAVAMLRKFRDEVREGNVAITYSSETRKYLIGTVRSEYEYCPPDEGEEGFAQVHRVHWRGEVSRDLLSTKTKNSLGSTLTLFSLNQEVINELEGALSGRPPEPAASEGAGDEVVDLKDQVVSQSHELIKDKLQSLGPEEMEEMAAAVLRAMGYKTKVSPKGPDRGVDVLASPDGLGLTQPRIKVEVKHREGSMGAQQLRSFLGALREGDTGLYLSTGGFTKDARYEAERATMPVTLVDMDDLADLVVAHYENFDLEGRALMPMIRLYWPAE
ncbi:restriction endonuclease [Microbulbifer zhoushanensis]|uniref:restriction endonuclease n=1 Tax=Microbulbifer TaxID=48073 RepID=UPI001F002140|nr:restriction endonuclease [Microbulbifer zhoushanensis]